MLIDKKGKIFGKISVVDIFVLVLVLVLAVGFYYKYNKTNVEKMDTIRTTFYSAYVLDNVVDDLQIGDIVTDKDTNNSFGKIISITKGDSVVLTNDADGIGRSSTKPGFSSVRIVVEEKGKYTQSGAVLNNIEYYIGKSFFSLTINKVSFPSMIYDIKKQ